MAVVGIRVAATIVAKWRDVDISDLSTTATAEIGAGRKLDTRYSARPNVPKTPPTQQGIILQGLYVSMQCFSTLLVRGFPVTLTWFPHYSLSPLSSQQCSEALQATAPLGNAADTEQRPASYAIFVTISHSPYMYDLDTRFVKPLRSRVGVVYGVPSLASGKDAGFQQLSRALLQSSQR